MHLQEVVLCIETCVPEKEIVRAANHATPCACAPLPVGGYTLAGVVISKDDI